MSLKERITEDLKAAMKSGDKLRLETIRSIRALILEYEKSGATTEMTPGMEISLVTSAAKKRKDSIEQYTKAGRIDLAQKEESELQILNEYLPKQMTVDELYAEIKKLAQEIGASSKQDFSKLMPLAAKTFKGKADGKTIKEVVEKILS
jgi:uncharacterized protein YqeY